jgi:DNA-directed RNA polymerase specialized sigma subunit
MPRKMDDAEVIEIREKLRDGKSSVTELMEEYNRARLAIYYAAKGITFKHLNEEYPPVVAIGYRRAKQKVTQRDHARIAERYDAGETQQEIADSYDVDISYICRIINEQRQLS